MKKKSFQLDSLNNNFLKKLLFWGSHFDSFLLLDSNTENKIIPAPQDYYNFDFCFACDSVKSINSEKDKFENIFSFHKKENDWLFGHLSYDLKNQFENLKSENSDRIEFPDFNFFVPTYIFLQKDGVLEIYIHDTNSITADNLLIEIERTEIPRENEHLSFKLNPVFSKRDYLDTIVELQKHIQAGNIYEINFCQEFFTDGELKSPVSYYLKLREHSPAPFASFYKHDKKYLLSASPERFIRKSGQKLISQPIKGTARRGVSEEEDSRISKSLLNDPKERSENIMITDLVRNDLSKSAKANSVKVEELCGLYSFSTVHQLISTISSEIKHNIPFTEIMKNTFPMGSMTGAPKIRAMKLIESYEKTKRGLYSGSVGYINPEGDFDFSVIIRSIVYNSVYEKISVQVGGAITINSIPENEYEECLIKLKSLERVLK